MAGDLNNAEAAALFLSARSSKVDLTRFYRKPALRTRHRLRSASSLPRRKLPQ